MTDTPLESARRAAAAARDEDWRGVARECDPLSLELFKRQWIAQYSQPRRPPLSAEEMRRRQPDLPEEVARWQAERIRRHYEEGHRNVGAGFAGVSTVEELSRMEPEEVFARFLEARSPRGHMERLVTEGKAPRDMLDRLARQPSSSLFPEPLGAIAVDDDHAFVLSARLDDSSFPWPDTADRKLPELTEQELQLLRWSGAPVRVLRARRQADGGWRLIAGEDFQVWSGVGHMRMAFVMAAPVPPSSS